MPYGPSHDLVGMDEGFDDPPGRAFRLLPYPLLAAAFLLTVAEDVAGSSSRPMTLVAALTAAAALWSALLLQPRHSSAQHQVHYAVYTAGRLVLTAALVLTAPWFGIFAWFGYVEAIRYFPRPRVFAVLFLNALVTSTSYLGGTPNDLSGWGFYALVVVASTTLVSFFAVAANRSRDRDDDRTRTLEQLQQSNAALERAITENRALQDELVARARETGVLDERARLAGEIHDTLAQALTGVITQLDAAGRSGEVRHDDHLGRARALARDGLTEARRSLHALRPAPLDDAPGLPGALAETAARWSGTAGLTAGVDVNGDIVALSNDAEIALLRTAQEGLANIAKHARASRVGLTLTYLTDAVLLDVRDDGVGFRPEGVEAARDGHRVGLVTMRERLTRVGGALDVESEPGAGTALVARVPVR